MSDPLVEISLWCHHFKMITNGASSPNTNYIDIFPEILNLEGHQNCCIGSKVMAILLNGWILTTGGVGSVRVCACSLRSRLALLGLLNFFLSLFSSIGTVHMNVSCLEASQLDFTALHLHHTLAHLS